MTREERDAKRQEFIVQLLALGKECIEFDTPDITTDDKIDVIIDCTDAIRLLQQYEDDSEMYLMARIITNEAERRRQFERRQHRVDAARERVAELAKRCKRS
jgi:hypothetical protein